PTSSSAPCQEASPPPCAGGARRRANRRVRRRGVDRERQTLLGHRARSYPTDATQWPCREKTDRTRKDWPRTRAVERLHRSVEAALYSPATAGMRHFVVSRISQEPRCAPQAGRVVPRIDRSRCEAKSDCVRVCPYHVFELRDLLPEERSE